MVKFGTIALLYTSALIDQIMTYNLREIEVLMYLYKGNDDPYSD